MTLARTLTLLVAVAGLSQTAAAQTPARTGRVIATPEERAVLQATPITQRPNRPLHFYGNTVRWINRRAAR